MTDPIVLRSEILSLLQSGGLGNAGTTGSGTYDSLQSQLISLSTRLAKIEGSSTYQQEAEETAAANSFWYDDALGICVVSGTTVITSTLAAGEPIKLLTIDSTNHLPPNTDFIGAANAYLSNASVGGKPTQLALSFNGLDLMATSENYIPASSTSTWFVEYHTMWIMKNFTTNVSSISWSSIFSTSSADYIKAITKNGITFIFAYLDSAVVPSGRNYTVFSDTNDSFIDNNTGSYNVDQYFGDVYRLSGNTVERGYMYKYKNGSMTPSSIACYPVISGEKMYSYAVIVGSNATLGQVSTDNNINSTYFDTTDSKTRSWSLSYKGLNVMAGCYKMAKAHDTTATWYPVNMITPAILPDDASLNFVPMLVGNNETEIPVNVSNGNVVIQMKPDLNDNYRNYIRGTILVIKRVE